MQNGTVEIGHTASYYYFGKDPTFAFGTSVPFGPNQRINQAWYMLGGGKDVLNEFYKKYNCVIAARRQHRLPDGRLVPQGDQHRRRSQGPEDCASAASPARVLQKLGVVPQQIAGGDIYPALEKGTIDAAEWVGPYDDEKLGFYKVAPHYYYPGWWEGGPMLLAFVNLDKWNALPKHYQSDSRAGRSLRQQLDDGEVRSGQSAGAAQAARQRRQAACVLAADHGSLLQGDQGAARRSRREQSPTSRRSTTR